MQPGTTGAISPPATVPVGSLATYFPTITNPGGGAVINFATQFPAGYMPFTGPGAYGMPDSYYLKVGQTMGWANPQLLRDPATQTVYVYPS